MIYLIPMAGEGIRTKELGEYKPFIEINGKKIIEYCINGIKWNYKKGDELCFIIKKEHDNKYNVIKILKKIIDIPHRYILIDKTDSQYETIREGMKLFYGNICIVNSDQFNIFQMPKKIIDDIYIPVYYEGSGKLSYIGIYNSYSDEIYSIVEKELISYIASSGVYIFKENFEHYFDDFESSYIGKSEIYISSFIQYLIDRNKKARALTTYCKFDLGNVETIKKMRDYGML